MSSFRVVHRRSELRVVFNDGTRIVIKDDEGNVAFDGTVWLFEQCWERGWFVKF